MFIKGVVHPKMRILWSFTHILLFQTCMAYFLLHIRKNIFFILIFQAILVWNDKKEDKDDRDWTIPLKPQIYTCTVYIITLLSEFPTHFLNSSWSIIAFPTESWTAWWICRMQSLKRGSEVSSPVLLRAYKNMNTQFIISKEMAYCLVLSTIFSSWFAWKGNTKIYRGLWYVFVPINHSLYIGYIMYMCATCDLQYMDIFNYGLKSDTLVLQCDSAYISLIIVLTISHLEGICFHKSVIYSCNISVMHKAVW